MFLDIVLKAMEFTSDRSRLVRQAQFLSWFTIIYNVCEGIVSIWFGVGEGSVSLAGFGMDSLIEVASAFVVLWRFKTESGGLATEDSGRERRATRLIGWLFISLSATICAAALLQAISGTHPATTVPELSFRV
jgi:hypothetical protein